MPFDFASIIKQYNIKVTGIIHAGGNEGEEVPLYKTYTDNIHIFEPIPWSFEKIDNNVKKYNVAVGSEKGTGTLLLASNNQSSSFLSPKTHLQEHPWVSFSGQLKTEIHPIDEYEIKDCNVLNIDVQGFELEVLKGAKNTLRGIDVIFSEINEKELYENCAMLSDVDLYLEGFDFKRVDMNMTEHGWGDACYIKKHLL